MYAGRFGYPRWVGGGGYSRGGLDLGIGSDGYFDHTGSRPVAEVYIAPRAVEWLIRKLFGAKQRHQLGVILRTFFKE